MKHFGTTVTWIANPPINTVHVEHFASNNGQKELIHYTSLKEKRQDMTNFNTLLEVLKDMGMGCRGRTLHLIESSH